MRNEVANDVEKPLKTADRAVREIRVTWHDAKSKNNVKPIFANIPFLKIIKKDVFFSNVLQIYVLTTSKLAPEVFVAQKRAQITPASQQHTKSVKILLFCLKN